MKYETCNQCGRSPFCGRKDCDACREFYNDYMNKRRRQTCERGMCCACYVEKADIGFTRCPECREKDRKYTSHKKRKNKDKVFNFYGGYRCACCGEDTPSFLTIDHVNNDGSKHKINGRRLTGHMLHSWIIKNGFPADFQVLCWNCNCGKIDGVCPHKLKDSK